jgi:hypothetical protein
VGLRLLGGRGRRRRREKILFERAPSRGPEGKIDGLREEEREREKVEGPLGQRSSKFASQGDERFLSDR